MKRLLLCWAVVAIAACGEGPTYQADLLAPLEGGLYRLTASTGADRAPAWFPGSDSVAYVAAGYPGIPATPGVPVALAARGGRLRILGAGLLSQGERWMEAVRPSPRGERLALTELAATAVGPFCVGRTSADDTLCSGAYEPRVDSLAWTVVDREAGHVVATVGAGTGARALHMDEEGPRIFHEATAFQQRFTTTASVGSTASWAPAGDRLVLSDGRQLMIWTPASGALQVIPGTANGLDPAWSPDGAWIAFTQLATAAPTEAACVCPQGAKGIPVPMTRVIHPVTGATLRLVRPDGSETLEVAAGGEEAAWGPDGSLYFRLGAGIRVVSPGATSAVPVPGTEHAERPAVSADGQWLAFQRAPSPGSALDIWVMRLPGGGS